jgi:preprotein translocase subunit SecD
MDRTMKWRFAWMTLLLVLAICTLVPSLVSSKSLPTWFSDAFSNKVQLGLDLQGGLQIVYSVDLDKAVDVRDQARPR